MNMMRGPLYVHPCCFWCNVRVGMVQVAIFTIVHSIFFSKFVNRKECCVAVLKKKQWI